MSSSTNDRKRPPCEDPYINDHYEASNDGDAADDVTNKKQKTAVASCSEDDDNSQEDTTPLRNPSNVVVPHTIASHEESVKLDAEDDEHNNHKQERPITISDDQKVILQLLDYIKKNTNCCVDVMEGMFSLIKRMVRNSNNNHQEEAPQENLMKCVIDANGISLITAVMKKHLDQQGLQNKGRALVDLLCLDVKEKANAKNIQAMLIAMKTLPGDYALLTKCCAILGNAARSDERVCEIIGESEGIALIVAVLELAVRQEQQDMLEPCLGALVNLTFGCDLNRQRVADAGGIALVIDALMNTRDTHRVRYGITVLRNLALRSEEIARRIVQAKGHVAVVACMMKDLGNVYFQEHGCWAMANLAVYNHHHKDGVASSSANEGGDDEKAEDVGAIISIVNALNAHPNVLGVKKGACRALCRLSNKGTKLQKSIVSSGGLEILSGVIRLHSSDKNDEDFVGWAKEAVRNCLSC